MFWGVISTTCNHSNWIMFDWRVPGHVWLIYHTSHIQPSLQPRWARVKLWCVVMLLNVQYVAVDECLSVQSQCSLFRAVLLHLLLQPPGCHLITVKLLDWLFLDDGQSCNLAVGTLLLWQAISVSSECVCLVCLCALFKQYVYYIHT